MNEDIVKKAILTLEVLIDCCKEDVTSYTARKEWEALEVFQQLQNNWNELKRFLEEKMSDYEHKEASNFYVVFEKMQELQEMNRVQDEYGNIYFISELKDSDD